MSKIEITDERVQLATDTYAMCSNISQAEHKAMRHALEAVAADLLAAARAAEGGGEWTYRDASRFCDVLMETCGTEMDEPGDILNVLKICFPRRPAAPTGEPSVPFELAEVAQEVLANHFAGYSTGRNGVTRLAARIAELEAQLRNFRLNNSWKDF